MPSNPRTGAAAPIDLTPRHAAVSRPALTNSPITPGPPTGPTDLGGGPGGGPTGGPGGGPTGGPGGTGGETGGGPTGGPGGTGGETGGGPTGGPGGTGGAPSGSTEDEIDGKIADSLLALITSATSGDALEAQKIILRRIALQGDVVPSRVPAPKNITEIGGYLNLLGTLNLTDMRSQVLAGILGVAGPNPEGWLSSTPLLTLVPMTNDRPAGPAQATIPVTVPVRSDFVAALGGAIQTLHNQGCVIPLMGGPLALPASGGNALPPADPLPYLGRVLTLATVTALLDPTSDPLALIRPQGTSDPFRIAARASGAGSATVTAANYDALKCTDTECTPITLTGAKIVYLEPVLANAGFYPASPPPQPASLADKAWARLTNLTGLVPGVTKLGDELALLYSWDAIAASVFSGVLGRVWNGSAFASPVPAMAALSHY